MCVAIESKYRPMSRSSARSKARLSMIVAASSNTSSTTAISHGTRPEAL